MNRNSFYKLFSIKIFIRRKFPYIYRQIYYFWWQHCVRLFWLIRFKPKGVLVYVGLNKGNSFANIHYKYKLAIGYEPNPKLFKELKNKFKSCKNVRLFNFAASDKNSEEKFYISDNQDMVSSSLSKFSKKLQQKIGYKKIINVNTINLGEHLEGLNIDYIDEYLSDAQGYDLTILKSLEKFIKKNSIKKITCEVTRNFRDNMYFEADNYEKSFESFLPNQYIKVATGESNLKEGEFQSVPDSHNSYDVMWINKSNYEIQ